MVGKFGENCARTSNEPDQYLQSPPRFFEVEIRFKFAGYLVEIALQQSTTFWHANLYRYNAINTGLDAFKDKKKTAPCMPGSYTDNRRKFTGKGIRGADYRPRARSNGRTGHPARRINLFIYRENLVGRDIEKTGCVHVARTHYPCAQQQAGVFPIFE